MTKADLYTRIVLTIIALSLCALVLQNNLQPAAARSGECGGDRYNPCYVKVIGSVHTY